MKNPEYKRLKHYSVYVFLMMLFGCNTIPQTIDYGNEACHFCKMTIVDKSHAAEIVTKKGKVYKFDATECMIHFLKVFNNAEVKLYLAINYSKPESFTDATKATFLISENIPSPMGAFLSAFKNETDAVKMQTEKGGELYTWEALIDYLK